MPRMTPEQYREFQIRMHGMQETRRTCLEGVKHEVDLHNDIMEECQRRGWIAFHGSMAAATHRTLGEPDFQIVADKGRTFYIECKSRTGKLSPAQQAMQANMKHLSHEMHVCRSMED